MLREPYAAAGLVAGLPCILFDGGFRLREFHSTVGHLATIREAHSERGGALMGLVIAFASSSSTAGQKGANYGRITMAARQRCRWLTDSQSATRSETTGGKRNGRPMPDR